MSKSNFNISGSKTDKLKDLDLEGSYQFTFRGEDDTYESFQLSGYKLIYKVIKNLGPTEVPVVTIL